MHTSQLITSGIQPHKGMKDFFGNRKVAVCSMHGKDIILRPLVQQYLGLDTMVVKGLDTDAFGTFSGEVERVSDPVTTLRRKIMEGLALSGETLGIGNEGSFGPHPFIPFVQADQEIVMLIDLERNWEIFEVITSADTNHAEQEITSMKDLLDFTDRVGFPKHGLILKEVKDEEVVNMRKGIVTWECLYATAYEFRTPDTKLIAQTDMRAYLNPTRMKAIETAAKALMEKIVNTCPECNWPGFSCVEIKPGLPCKQCGSATNLPRAKVYQCKSCSYTDERYYIAGETADAQYCDRCNP